MVSQKDLISIRDYNSTDRNFILATWLRGMYYGDTMFSHIPKNIFMENYHRILERFLLAPGVIIKIACLKDEPEVILGYSVSRKLQHGEADVVVLDWMFVKSAWRKIGIGKLLIPNRVNACTHLTKVGLAILKTKLPNVIFNPFLM